MGHIFFCVCLSQEVFRAQWLWTSYFQSYILKLWVFCKDLLWGHKDGGKSPFSSDSCIFFLFYLRTMNECMSSRLPLTWMGRVMLNASGCLLKMTTLLIRPIHTLLFYIFVFFLLTNTKYLMTQYCFSILTQSPWKHDWRGVSLDIVWYVWYLLN